MNVHPVHHCLNIRQRRRPESTLERERDNFCDVWMCHPCRRGRMGRGSKFLRGGGRKKSSTPGPGRSVHSPTGPSKTTGIGEKVRTTKAKAPGSARLGSAVLHARGIGIFQTWRCGTAHERLLAEGKSFLLLLNQGFRLIWRDGSKKTPPRGV